ncbi:transmembrane anchor protein [Stenotrophomonas maltophilia]|uniref:Transmembrane anchor protein n=1 Tax=Stenotrophomonas maltophilia TaxID=40324 RepID=A0A2J0U7R3_STEMA|nr:transmembrane anchor protein [Stenotrophomonas maltophilia]PJL25347.1 transmembrane anchor protein [Stenotrophomonas maltophilia]
MYNSKPAEGDLPTSRQLGRTTAIAAGIAIILLVGVVMPSEYGIDPTGVGRVLGLKEMGEIKEQLAEEAAADAAMDAKAAEDEAAALLTQVSTQNRKTVEVAQKPAASNAATAAKWRDEEQVVLTPGQGTEIKLVMKAGERASYQWSVEGGVVNFDTHGDGGGRAISYEKGRGEATKQGVLLAAFDGNHGWFWRNRGEEPVTLLLRTGGEYELIKKM